MYKHIVILLTFCCYTAAAIKYGKRFLWGCERPVKDKYDLTFIISKRGAKPIRMAICNDRKSVQCVDSNWRPVTCPQLGSRRVAIAAHGFSANPSTFKATATLPSLAESLQTQNYDVILLDWRTQARVSRPKAFDKCKDIKNIIALIKTWYVAAGGKNKCGRFEKVCSFRAASLNGVPKSAAELAAAVAYIRTQNSTSFIHLLGHSIGAHVVGQAGKMLQQNHSITVDRITGLDPAKPLFYDGDDDKSLTRDDAKFVDIIHTNPACLGAPDRAGHVDIFFQDTVAPGKPVPIPTHHTRLTTFKVVKCLFGSQSNDRCLVRQVFKHSGAKNIFVASIGDRCKNQAMAIKDLDDKLKLPAKVLKTIGFGNNDFLTWFQHNGLPDTAIEAFVEIQENCPKRGLYRKQVDSTDKGVSGVNSGNPWNVFKDEFNS